MEEGRNLHSLKQEPTADTYEPEKEAKDDVKIFSWVSGKKEVSLTMSEVHFFFVFILIMRNPGGDVEWGFALWAWGWTANVTYKLLEGIS